jgi:hypothetical protein
MKENRNLKGCCYYDKSSRGYEGRHRPRGKFRVEIPLGDGKRLRRYFESYNDGIHFIENYNSKGNNNKMEEAC